MNPFTQRERDFKFHVEQNLAEGEVQPKSGFYDAWQASLGLFIDENLSISRYINTDAYRERNGELRKMLANGDIPSDIAGTFVQRTRRGDRIDYAGLASYVNDNLSGDLQTDEEIDASIRDTLKQRRDYAERTMERTSVSGTIGTLAGGLTAVALDPVNVMSFMATPYRAMQGIGILQNVLRAGGKEAIVGAAAETAIQPLVLNWKQEIGAPYSPVEAIQNIGFAAGFGFLLGSAAQGIDVVRGRNTNTVKTQDFKVSDAKEELDAVIAQADENIDVINADPAARSAYEDIKEIRDNLNGADPDIQAAEHFAAIHKQLEAQSSDAPRYEEVNLSEFDDTRLDLELQELGDIEIPTRVEMAEDGTAQIQTDSLTNIVARADAEEAKLQDLRACIIG